MPPVRLSPFVEDRHPLRVNFDVAEEFPVDLLDNGTAFYSDYKRRVAKVVAYLPYTQMPAINRPAITHIQFNLAINPPTVLHIQFN